MQKTETIKLNVDMISMELYLRIVNEFQKSRPNVVYVNEIKIEGIVEYEE